LPSPIEPSGDITLRDPTVLAGGGGVTYPYEGEIAAQSSISGAWSLTAYPPALIAAHASIEATYSFTPFAPLIEPPAPSPQVGGGSSAYVRSAMLRRVPRVHGVTGRIPVPAVRLDATAAFARTFAYAGDICIPPWCVSSDADIWIDFCGCSMPELEVIMLLVELELV
jgi:hypothetical protein